MTKSANMNMKIPPWPFFSCPFMASHKTEIQTAVHWQKSSTTIDNLYAIRIGTIQVGLVQVSSFGPPPMLSKFMNIWIKTNEMHGEKKKYLSHSTGTFLQYCKSHKTRISKSTRQTRVNDINDVVDEMSQVQISGTHQRLPSEVTQGFVTGVTLGPR